MAQPDPALEEPNVGVLLFVAYRHLEQRVVSTVVEHGYPITLAQARLLARVDSKGTRTTRLAESAQVTKQTAGYLVDQLEDAGYVVRVPDPRDARAKLVRLTDLAQQLAAVAGTEEARVEGEWRRHLGAERWEQLRDILGDLRTVTDPYTE